MIDSKPWLPGCIVLGYDEINARDPRQVAMAAIAEIEVMRAIYKAMAVEDE